MDISASGGASSALLPPRFRGGSSVIDATISSARRPVLSVVGVVAERIAARLALAVMGSPAFSPGVPESAEGIRLFSG